MSKCFKVTYINWKNKKLTEYIYALSLEQAIDDANIIQGLEKIISIEEIT